MTELRARLQSTLGEAYTIERELGGGGMSRVFVAMEESLGRPVVVKVLPSEMAGALSVERFRREIRLAASLQQANIVPVLSAGDADGVAYYTMPFVKGESLRSHLATKGALPVAECVAILRDVARALAFAHAEGVVHRDIKPENILLSGGTAVVTDFGIAKAVAASSTQPGLATLTQMGIALGTPAYMAPEQAVGEDVDHRADIYALGIVAYEMLTGATPFAGRSMQAMLAAHVMEAPPPLRTKRPETPPRLAQLVTHCLEKEPSKRPVSAMAVIEVLETATTPSAFTPVVTGHSRAAPAENRASTIAVLPFANMSADADAEYFSDGMSEEVLNALVRVPGLRVIARTSSFAFKGKTADVREIGERLGAGVIVEGSVRKAAGRIRVTAQLIDATSGVQLWSERYDRALDDVFAVQDEITAAIRDALSEKLAGIGSLPRPKSVIDTETYELFLRARFQLNKPPDGLIKGAANLEQVVQRAPDYEPALAELSQALILQSNFGMIEPRVANPRAIALAQRAIALDPMDPLPHAVAAHSALYFSYDWPTAQRHFERAVEIAPNHPIPLAWFGFFHSSVGRHAEAIATTKQAVSLDPLNLLTRLISLFSHHHARRFDDVIALSNEMAEIDPNFSEAYRLCSFALLKKGLIDDARRAGEMAVRLSSNHPYHVFHLALVHLAAGERHKAEEIGRQFGSMPASQSVYQLLFGNLNGHLGNYDVAFAALERYFDARGHWMAMLRVDPTYDPLRNDPRFGDLVRRVGVPDWGPPAARVEPAPRAKPSIAVLPLTNMSASADDEYFSDGVTEDIIAQLSRIASLRVIARTSVMQYKKTGKRAREIASELGVSHIVEGSVRRAGQRLRIVAQLVDAASEAPLWNETFDRDLIDVFAVQSEVSERVATALRATLAGAVRERPRRSAPANIDAYDACLRGRFEAYKGTPDGYQRSIEHFERAIALDPRLAQAHLGLAETLVFQALFVGQPEARFPRARAHATKALELDESLPEAHAMLAYIAFWFDWDWNTAERLFSRAIELGPNSAIAHNYCAVFLANLGRHDDAIALSRRAAELDPLWSTAHQALGFALYQGGEYSSSVTASDRALDLAPDYAAALVVKGFALLELREYESALAAFRRTAATSPGVSIALGGVVQAQVRAGRIGEARATLADLRRAGSRGTVQSSALAWAHIALGELDHAFADVERGIAEHDAFIACLPTFAWWDPLRRDPRFTQIIDRLKFPDWSRAVSDARRLAYAERTQVAVAPAPMSVVAVLPLANLSASADDEYFADGMTEDIIAQLSKVASLKVISRTSVMRYKKTDESIKDIASKLGASHILEGTVRRAGNRLRIVTQLIEAASDAHVWAETYDRELTDVFATQSEVAMSVAGALKAVLTTEERARIVRRPTENLDAYNWYLLGRFSLNKRTSDAIARATEWFEQAIAADPRFALAHAGLADTFTLAAIGYGAAPADALPRAKRAALEAVRIDESLAEAHTSLGYVHLNYDWDFFAAERALRRAIELNPSSAQAHEWLAHAYLYVGRWNENDDGVAHLRIALDLDPLSVVLTAEQAWPYLYKRVFDRAIVYIRQALAMDPSFALAHNNLGWIYDETGRPDEAFAEHLEAARLSGGAAFIVAFLARAHVGRGNSQAAREILADLTEQATRGAVVNVFVAFIHDALGEPNDVIHWLERAYVAREPSLAFIHFGEWLRFVSVWEDPRFRSLLDRVGMAEQSRRVLAGMKRYESPQVSETVSTQ